MPKAETRYDKASDILQAKMPGESIKQSISLGNLDIDFDQNGRVVGVQILNASEMFHFSEEVEDPVSFLENIENAELDWKVFESGSLRVELRIFQQTDNMTQEAIVNSSAPAVALA